MDVPQDIEDLIAELDECGVVAVGADALQQALPHDASWPSAFVRAVLDGTLRGVALIVKPGVTPDAATLMRIFQAFGFSADQADQVWATLGHLR